MRMKAVLRTTVVAAAVACSALAHPTTSVQPQVTRARTQVVLLGTGTPLPDPDRAGPSVAIVSNGTPYIVDAGVGLVRRAAGVASVHGLRPISLKIAFLTHLHSDHTLGLPDLMMTPWIAEAYTQKSFAMVSPDWQRYRTSFHR